MKLIILPFIILTGGFSLAQKVLNTKKTVGDIGIYTPHIFDDGTSVVIENQGLNIPNYYLNTYTGDGEVIEQKKLEDSYWPEMFGAQGKYWLYYKVGGSKMTILHTDFSGNTVQTKLKDKCFDYQNAFTLINESGNMEIYLKHVKNNYKFPKNMIPYIMIEYNPIEKTCKLNKFIDIPGIEGEVRFIGTRNGEFYFVNWENEKLNYKFKILAVDDKNTVRTCTTFESFIDKNDIFMEIAYISHQGNMHDYASLYFTINTIAGSEVEKGALIYKYKIYQIDSDDQATPTLLNVNTKPLGPVSALPKHYPLHCFPEKSESTTFFLKDIYNTALVCEAKFDGDPNEYKAIDVPTTPNIYFYKEAFPALFEESMKYPEGKGVFKICEDGFARLLIVTKEGKCLLFKEEAK